MGSPSSTPQPNRVCELSFVEAARGTLHLRCPLPRPYTEITQGAIEDIKESVFSPDPKKRRISEEFPQAAGEPGEHA